MTAYQLIDPGIEWRFHREWYERSALPDLLGAGAEMEDIHTLYRCLDRLLPHSEGWCLLRTNLTDRDPAGLWELYMYTRPPINVIRPPLRSGVVPLEVL